MKRMAFVMAIIIVTLSTLLFVAGVSVVFAFTCVLLFGAVACICFKTKLKKYISSAAVLLFCAVFGLYLILFNSYTVQKCTDLIGKSGKVTCTVIEEIESYGDLSVLYIKTSSNKHENSELCKSVKFKLWISAEETISSAKVGDTFTADVTFREIQDAYRKNSYSQSCFISATAENFEVVGHKFSLYAVAVDIRKAVRGVINQHFTGDKRGILNGVILGGSSQLSDLLYNDFKSSGVMHITAVSGMHISIICMALLTVLGLFMHRRKAVIVALFPMFFVVAVTGFNASAVRAGIMCFIAFVGETSLKRTDGLNSLGLAVVGMLIINPFYVCDLGFCLSCSATAGVIVATKVYNDKIKSRLKLKNEIINNAVHTIGSVFIQSIGAVVFTMPLQILEFGYVSIAAPIASVAICAAVTYLLIFAVVGIILCFIPFAQILSNIFFAPVWLILEYIETVISAIARIPFSYIPFGHFWALLWIGLSVALVGTWSLLKFVGGKRFIVLLLSALLVISLWCHNYSTRLAVEISSVNLQKGFAVIIYYGEKCVIIGCGKDKADAYIISSELRLHGVSTVEAIFLPSNSENCSAGAAALCDVLNINVNPHMPTEESSILLLDSVTLTPVLDKNGCSFIVSVYDKCVLIGYGNCAVDLISPDVVFWGGALPQIDNPDILITSGTWIPKSKEQKYGKIYYVASSPISVKFSQGREVEVYAGKG